MHKQNRSKPKFDLRWRQKQKKNIKRSFQNAIKFIGNILWGELPVAFNPLSSAYRKKGENVQKYKFLTNELPSYKTI